ncbi:SDR family oxidoreductase [Arthrobacter zhangbolii]|uniref:SDR family oxidoreductase n=1 Tax=Arthrobacter zhangbolii TaxID=2886936 RepID=A0A9X1M791_9MICC|nr:SDR family oxidoreductase [Arthrobacter zhangbolii]MCC3271609.1 SDR family oxidoreductase [Arthrobacter zhangbolii]UON90629.1 SDR family oxidoreductase [Arthrobacter zhangbolii]
MSRIAIIGGHGKVALHLARRLTAANHSVTSVFRNPDHTADVEDTGAAAKVADVQALSTEEMAELLRGHDAVVWTAGAGGGSPERTFAVDRDAAIRSMDAAEAAGAKRYVMVSYFGAGKDHGVPEDDGFYAYAEAKADADEHLRASGLDWTILGPSALTLDPGTGRIETGSGVTGSQVSREDVAHVAAEVLDRPETAGRTIEFNNGTTPVAEALDAVAAQ